MPWSSHLGFTLGVHTWESFTLVVKPFLRVNFLTHCDPLEATEPAIYLLPSPKCFSHVLFLFCFVLFCFVLFCFPWDLNVKLLSSSSVKQTQSRRDTGRRGALCWICVEARQIEFYPWEMCEDLGGAQIHAWAAVRNQQFRADWEEERKLKNRAPR